MVPAVMVPSRKMDREKKYDDYNGLRAWARDVSKRSHSIKEIIVDLQLPTLSITPKLFSPTSPTPRRRGDGGDFQDDYFFNENEDDSEIETTYNDNVNVNDNDNEKRTMVDPPGYNESEGAKSTERSSKEPEIAGSIHRRRKRLLENQARRIIGGSGHNNNNNYYYNSSSIIKADNGRIDTTERTVSLSASSQHSSWVPSRAMDKDPNNKPVMTSETEARLSKQTMETYDRAVPQRSWQPDRQLPEKKRNGRVYANNKMDFDSTNEWVPSEFYRKHHQPPQAGQVTASHSGVPPIISPYPPTQRQQYQHQQHHQQQQQQQLQQQQRLRHQQQYIQQVQEQYDQQYQQQYQQQVQQQHRQPQHQQYQHQYQHQHQQEQEHQQEHQHQVQKVDRMPWRPHQLPQQPPSVIHTITTKSTPSTPTPDIHTITTATTPSEPTFDDDKMKRKSMASEMDLSDVVISSAENSTIVESSRGLKGKGKNRISEDSSTIIDSLKAKAKKRRSEESKDPNSNSKNSEESSTVLDSLKLRRQKSKKRWSDGSKDAKESEESSTMLDSYKALRKGKRDSDESWNPRDGSLKKIIDNTYSFDVNDDGFDESLLSSSLTNRDTHNDIPNKITIEQFVIPTIFVRKSGTSDITFDMDATRQMIESTLTMSDEDLTFGSTIHNGSTINNSIISQEDAAVAYAAVAAREMTLKERGLTEIITSGLIGKNIRARTLIDSGTTGVSDSLFGSNTSGLTGKHIQTKPLTESGVSGLTVSGLLGGKDATGEIIANKLSTLADEIGARARQKMEDIPSEVASYIGDTLSSNRQDSESDDRSSWHHRSNITTNSTMVSTKKAGNKKKKFRPRRSSTSTLPSIGSIIPEEFYNFGEDDESESDDDDDDISIYEIHHVSSESSYETDIDEDEIERKLASIPEVASPDASAGGTAIREISKGDTNRGIESGERSRGSSDRRKDNTNGNDNVNDNGSSSTMKDYCDCLDIRCFDKGEDGTGGRFNPTCGAYVVMFLVVFMIAVWAGIGIIWHRVTNTIIL